MIDSSVRIIHHHLCRRVGILRHALPRMCMAGKVRLLGFKPSSRLTERDIVSPPSLPFCVLTLAAQIWHIAIVLAVYFHYRAIFAAHNARLDYSCAVPGAGKPVGELLSSRISIIPMYAGSLLTTLPGKDTGLVIMRTSFLSPQGPEWPMLVLRSQISSSSSFREHLDRPRLQPIL